MARPPASEQVQVNFRMPADLKARIEAAAEANGRSTTSELVATLEEKYPSPRDTQDRMVEKLRVLMEMADDLVADPSSEANPVRTMASIYRVMRKTMDQLPVEVVTDTMRGWTPPPNFNEKNFPLAEDD